MMHESPRVMPRHHWVWLTDAAWQRLLAAPLAGGAVDAQQARQRDILCHWQRQAWPAVARRADIDTAPGQTSVGLALPPDAHGHKPRIALCLQADEVAEVRAPWLLHDILAAPPAGLPGAWLEALPALQHGLAAAGIAPAVFGSLAWQAMTGQSYLRGSSDIDLLWAPRDRAQLQQGVSLLAYHAMFLPLDGEIVFPGQRAVSWKEWRQVAVLGGHADGRVLVKSHSAVRLETVGALMDSLSRAGDEQCAA